MDKAIAKANRELEKASVHHCNIIYPAAAHILWAEYGWRSERIFKFFKVSQDVWNECVEHGTDKSMLEMLEEETGIEIAMSGDKSYHDFAYLDATKWDGKPPTRMQLIYIRKKQIEWLPYLMIACLCLSLHRKEGWGYERIARFISFYEALKAEHGDKEKNYRDLLTDTDIDPSELIAKVKGVMND